MIQTLKLQQEQSFTGLTFGIGQRLLIAAKEIGLDQISFLPADVSSHAFNREVLWSDQRQHEILIQENELDELKDITENIIAINAADPSFHCRKP